MCRGSHNFFFILLKLLVGMKSMTFAWLTFNWFGSLVDFLFFKTKMEPALSFPLHESKGMKK